MGAQRHAGGVRADALPTRCLYVPEGHSFILQPGILMPGAEKIMSTYTIGLDYGTNSVRGLLVDVATGEEVSTSVFDYPHGQAGILLDARDPDLARQHPQDYLDGAVAVIKGVLNGASSRPGFSAAQVIGIGVDTTGSTPIPVDMNGTPIAVKPEFANNLAAMVVLWKDHTGHAEASEITALAAKVRPEYLLKCGGTYSAEWYWAKVLHNLRATPDVFDAAYTWVEHADWLPGRTVRDDQARYHRPRRLCGWS